MIYEFPPEDGPIRQGDIFVGLPRVEVSLDRIPLVDEEGAHESPWAEVASAGNQVRAILPVRPVSAIVISQDCDTVHSQDISLCEIRAFRMVEGKAKQTRDTKGWVGILTQHARANLKWFYLPPSARLGFEDKMAVDFTVTLRVPRVELEAFRHSRKGRLNPLADEHFRERLAEFFRRYPYDEWYPLNEAELAEYRKKYPDAQPFAWQKVVAPE
ncbi:MAG: hypothetical protein ABSF26_18050 [Thermoguttaceae bacterium]